MPFRYNAPIPGSQVRKDFLLGNRLFRVIWGFTNQNSEIEFSTYIAPDTTDNIPDACLTEAEPNTPFAFEIDGELIPIPGNIKAIKQMTSLASAREIEIVIDGGKLGEIKLASWVAPDLRTVCIYIKAPEAANAALHFGRMKTGAVLIHRNGEQLDPSAPIPPNIEGEWKFGLSWENDPDWIYRKDVVHEYQSALSERTIVSMDNSVLADRANLIANTLEVSRRIDGRLPAGAHRAYNGAWIRDGVMDCIGMIYAGCSDMGNTLVYLLKNVPPKGGQLEEYGMMVFGLYHYFMATGDKELLRESMPYIKSFVNDVLDSQLIDSGTGLLASETEGYWERSWLGKAAELSQNAWAVFAVRLYTELGGLLNWKDDYYPLNSLADGIWAKAMAETGFVRDGKFVRRLLPGGERQVQGLVRRGLSLGANPYADQFAKPEDYEEVMVDLDPDVQTCVPWLWGLVDPRSDVSMATASEIWKLWNQDWDFGGLERYNVFSDCDRETAGPWFLASMMAARAFLLQDDYEKTSEIIKWADREFLGCGWSERISRAHPVDDPFRYVHEILNWPGGEYLMLVYREGAGLYPTEDGLVIQPHLPPDFAGLSIANFKYRNANYQIRYHGTGSEVDKIEFNGEILEGSILPAEDGNVEVYLQ